MDFIILDILCLTASYCLAYCCRFGRRNPFEYGNYVALLLFLELIYAACALLGKSLNNILCRGKWTELKSCLYVTTVLGGGAAMVLFFLKESSSFSRITVGLTCVLFFLSTFFTHILWKRFLRKHVVFGNPDAMLVAANAADMPEILSEIGRHAFGLPAIHGLIVLDGEAGMEGFPYPVVANARTMTEYITRNWVDELMIRTEDTPDLLEKTFLREELDKIAGSGVTVHQIICPEEKWNGRSQLVENMGGYTVLTDSIRIVSMRQAIFKRSLDIAGGLVGCVIAGLILLFIGPVLYIRSPGPLIFRQKRVGRNGKIFTMYKIRSMYPDADAKKKEFADANRIADGMMFKLDNDPRIIGSRITPDGVYHKGIGNFIRDFSLDEFPNFWNVLRGDMSLVGTRPPTLDEWEQYKPYHRARMAFRPGITGLWQISGRSDITDFDEVVRLDMQYISSWNVGADFHILLQTVLKVLKRDGAM